MTTTNKHNIISEGLERVSDAVLFLLGAVRITDAELERFIIKNTVKAM